MTTDGFHAPVADSSTRVEIATHDQRHFVEGGNPLAQRLSLLDTIAVRVKVRGDDTNRSERRTRRHRRGHRHSSLLPERQFDCQNVSERLVDNTALLCRWESGAMSYNGSSENQL